MLYNLACGQALNGKTADAERTLLQIAELRAVSDLDADTDFDSIRKTEGYRKAAAKMKALRTERISSGAVVAFTIPEKGLVPEGVAYDPVTKSFFVSSIRKRKVYRIDASGKASVFVAPREGGLRTAAGIAVDPKRRSLWVASGVDAAHGGLRQGRAAPGRALRVRRRHRKIPPRDPPSGDRETGRLRRPRGRRRRTRVPQRRLQRPRLDARAGRIGARDLPRDRPLPGHAGPRADSRRPKTLYVSDYSGLYRVEVASKKITRLAVPADVALNGVDGLVWAGGRLYAVQNGVEPNRVIRVDLSADGATVTGAKILEMNHPAFDEPTLAVVAEGALYVTANSQGGKFREREAPDRAGGDGRRRDPESAARPGVALSA